MTATTVEAVQQTLAEYERLAISTGDELRIDPPEFRTITEPPSFDRWLPIWPSSEPPQFARATVHRNGIPTTVYVSWEESLPAVDDWRSLWERKPMKLFGAYTLRAALRRAYRDVIGDRREPDESFDAPVAQALADEDRDWAAEMVEAETEEAVRQVHADAKKARAMTVELETAIRRRLAVVRAVPFLKEAAESIPRLAEGGIVQAKPGKPLPILADSSQERIIMRTPADLARALKSRPIVPKPRGPRD